MRGTSLHEDYSRKQEGTPSSDRGFGIVFAIFFSLVGFSPLRTHRPVRWWALIVACVFLAIALLRPIWLRPLNRAWTKLGRFLGRVVSPVITTLMFFVVVTPTALLFRLLGKDPLRLASGSGSTSYWIERKPPGPPPETMLNQF